MLFDDDFVFGRPGSTSLGALDGVFSGPSRLDAGEIIITGRVPGALYIDDLPGGMTALDRILPFQYVDGLPLDEVLDGPIGGPAEAIGETASEPGPADPEPASPSTDPEPQGLALAAEPKGDDTPQVLITQDDGEPLAGPFGEIDLADFGRPVIDLAPVQPVISVTAPDMAGGEQPAPVIPGGRAYQSLSFLLIDTPFVIGDDNLPPTVRPPLNQLLGLPDEDEVGQTWVLPTTGRGAWVLR